MVGQTGFGRRVRALAGACAFALACPASAQTLAEAVESMLLSNPDVAGVLATLRATGFELDQADAALYPTIDWRYARGRERTNSVLFGNRVPSLTRTENGLTLRQLLFDAYGAQSEIERQSARVSSARYKAVDTVETTALRAAEAYVNVRRERELLSLARNNRDRHGEYLRLVELRRKSGIGTEADVQQAAARAAQAQSNVISREGNLRDAEDRYLRILNTRPGELARLPDFGPLLPSPIEKIRTEVAATHPRVLSAAADVDAGRAQVRGAKAPLYPRLDLELGASWNRNLDGIVGINNDLTAMVVMRYNLFRGGADVARVSELRERETVLETGLDSAKREVVEGVSTAWTSIGTSRGAIVALTAQAEASSRLRDAYLDQFELGRRTLLDLLNNENEIYQSTSQLESARNDLRFAEYRLLAGTAAFLPALGIAPSRVVPPEAPR